jgi:eukaryotic-like serine/threonine-protein kinase
MTEIETLPAGEEAWLEPQIGRYVFRRVVGSGGMGIVVAAHDPELDREVAIKIVVTGASDDARPVREAQAMARLSHPNVVQVYEVIRLDVRTAIVMELVEGEELGVWQAADRSWREIVDAYVQASRGLAAAHRAGLVHGDFKPANALIDRDGVVRVTDFGLARRASDVATMAGTPAYMAPEQHRGGAIDARTDQWSLACSLYEALYKRRPFESAQGSLADAVTRGEIDAEPADSKVPRRIRAAIRRGLATDPDQRFATIEDFAAAVSVPSRRRHYAVGAIATALVATIVVLSVRGGSPSSCEGLDAPLRAVWTDHARSDLRARMLAPGVGLPETTVDKALAGLDAYASTWTITRTHACTDSQQGVRSAETLDTRMRCLDRRLAAMSGLLEGLATNDAATLRATSDAVIQLQPAGDCSEATDLVARPASAEMRNELDDAEHGVARATALVSLGQLEQAVPIVERAAIEGEHAHAPSVVARALLIRGECEDRRSHYPAALATYQQAAKLAAQAQDHVTLADALTRVFMVEGNHMGHRGDALRERSFIELAIESAGKPELVRAAWLHDLAMVLYEDASLVGEAATDEREALAIRRRILPAGHIYIFDSMETLANIEVARSNYDEGTRLLSQVLEGRIASRGPNDHMVSSAYNNLGIVEIQRDNLLGAIDYLERSVDVGNAAGQPNSNAQYNLAITQLELGRTSAAAKSFAVALDTAERVAGKESSNAGQASMLLGAALIATGDYERGRPALLHGVDLTRRSGSASLATALAHAARLALHDGDRKQAHVLLDESLKLPTTNAPLRSVVAAELLRAEAGCAVAKPAFAKALAEAVADEQQRDIWLAIVPLAECEIATGDARAAQQRLEPELAWLVKGKADDHAIAPVQAALAKARDARSTAP